MQLTLRHHLQHARELPAQARGADAQVGFCLGEMQRLHAVVEHGAVRVLAVKPTSIDLPEVHKQPRAQLALLSE